MRLGLILFFVFFSLFSSVVENAEAFDACSGVAEHAVSQHDCHSDLSPMEKKGHSGSCHDSNCYGSAHFGHGYYHPQRAVAGISFNPSLLFRLGQFSLKNLMDSAPLEGPFRPPLSA